MHDLIGFQIETAHFIHLFNHRVGYVAIDSLCCCCKVVDEAKLSDLYHLICISFKIFTK